MTRQSSPSLSTLEYHLLLAIADGPLHGYAIREAVEAESYGSLTPRAGTLYRVIARLMGGGLVEEVGAPDPEEKHPGRDRRYYGLTPMGRDALADEATRLTEVAAMARTRLRAT
jgi:DNA-binding PadR family transcriptional regulator